MRGWWLPAFLALAAAPAVRAASSEPPRVAVRSRIEAPGPGSFYHGVYPGGRSGDEDDLVPADLDAYEKAAGRRAAWVYFSHNWYRGHAFPRATASWIRERGAVPFIRLMLRSDSEQNHPEPRYSLKAILAGRFDHDLAAWGDAAREFGTPVLAEWGAEMNGKWFSWNGSWNGGRKEGPRRFREAYRRIVRMIRSRGADNVLWVFHANDEDQPEADWNRLENYYPGDDVVDWLGVSVYGAQTPIEEEWPAFAERMDRAASRFARLAPGKPTFVLEFGATTGHPRGKAAAWAEEALSQILSGRWPQVRGFSWWNETWANDDDPAHRTDMRVQSDPGLTRVFKAHLAGPRILDRPILPPP